MPAQDKLLGECHILTGNISLKDKEDSDPKGRVFQVQAPIHLKEGYLLDTHPIHLKERHNPVQDPFPQKSGATIVAKIIKSLNVQLLLLKGEDNFMINTGQNSVTDAIHQMLKLPKEDQLLNKQIMSTPIKISKEISKKFHRIRQSGSPIPGTDPVKEELLISTQLPML